MRTHKYPSDVSDAQWRLIEPLIPVYPGGRPRKTPLRDVVDAILYVLRTGCQWRYLPKDFPPRSTAWRYFDEWRHNGTLDAIHDALRRKVRTQEKPYAPRTTASVDSQSVDTTSGGERRGRDNAKNVDGHKRHIVVDSMHGVAAGRARHRRERRRRAGGGPSCSGGSAASRWARGRGGSPTARTTTPSSTSGSR